MCTITAAFKNTETGKAPGLSSNAFLSRKLNLQEFETQPKRKTRTIHNIESAVQK